MIGKILENVWFNAVVLFPSGMYMYHTGMVVLGGANAPLTFLLAFVLIIGGFLVVQVPYFYFKDRYFVLKDQYNVINQNVSTTTRSDTGSTVLMDNEDDVDGDGRGGDTLRRMGIID